MAGLAKDRHDPLSPQDRSALMSKVRGKGNRSTELVVASRLTKEGVLGWEQHPPEITGKPDFFFPKLKFALFVDGCFWHGCPICQRNNPKTRAEFWSNKIEGNRDRDRKVNKELKLQRYHVMRVWEHEILADTWYRKFRRRLMKYVTQTPLGSMPPKPRRPRLPTALRSALAQLQAGTSPQDVAADLIRKHAERVVLCAQLPPGDPQLPAFEALTLALGLRTFDDSAISLDACLRDIEEVGSAVGRVRDTPHR